MLSDPRCGCLFRLIERNLQINIDVYIFGHKKKETHPRKFFIFNDKNQYFISLALVLFTQKLFKLIPQIESGLQYVRILVHILAKGKKK